MKVVKVTLNDSVVNLEALIPSDLRESGKYVFVVNEKIPECDFWFVIGRGGLNLESTVVCPENTFFVTSEPPSYYRYNNFYAKQFGHVLSCFDYLNKVKCIESFPLLPYHIGRVKDDNAVKYAKDYNDIARLDTPKLKNLSILVSNKAVTLEHKKRLEFVLRIKKHFKDKVDLFGRGFAYVGDKLDGIAPYKYHLVLENSSYKNYWTEKLADCYLGRAFPIYYGCPNLSDYFDPKSFLQIDIESFDETVRRIEEIIDSDLYDAVVPNINKSRDAVLNKYNMFNVMSGFCEEYQSSCFEKKRVLIINDALFVNRKKVYYFFDKVRHFFK